jgi:hypothetical protein
MALPTRNGIVLAASVAALGLACAKPGAPAVAPKDGPIVVPIQIVNNHVYLHMTGAGRDLSLIYDTGAGWTLLELGAAQSLGFRIGGKVNLGGAGSAPVRAFALSSGKLALPQDTTVQVKPIVAFETTLGQYEGIRFDGILGADFTRQFVVQLDYAGERMLLHPRSFRYTGSATRIPITFKDGKPHAVGQIILADSARLPADCLIDVGASAPLVLSKPFVEKHRLLQRVGPTIRRRAGRGVGGSSWATIGRIPGVQIGTAVLQSPVTAMYGDSAGTLSSSNFDCNIGGETLRRFNVFFDYGRKEMILEPTAAVSEPFETDMSGASFRVDAAAGGIRMVELMPRGPAEAAGLREDDLIVSIDGRPALEMGLEAFRRRLKRPGGEVELTIRRGQTDQTFRLPIRRLI